MRPGPRSPRMRVTWDSYAPTPATSPNNLLKTLGKALRADPTLHAARATAAGPNPLVRSTLDVEGIDLDLTADEVVNLIREGRERRG